MILKNSETTMSRTFYVQRNRSVNGVLPGHDSNDMYIDHTVALGTAPDSCHHHCPQRCSINHLRRRPSRQPHPQSGRKSQGQLQQSWRPGDDPAFQNQTQHVLESPAAQEGSPLPPATSAAVKPRAIRPTEKSCSRCIDQL